MCWCCVLNLLFTPRTRSFVAMGMAVASLCIILCVDMIPPPCPDCFSSLWGKVYVPLRPTYNPPPPPVWNLELRCWLNPSWLPSWTFLGHRWKSSNSRILLFRQPHVGTHPLKHGLERRGKATSRTLDTTQPGVLVSNGTKRNISQVVISRLFAKDAFCQELTIISSTRVFRWQPFAFSETGSQQLLRIGSSRSNVLQRVWSELLSESCRMDTWLSMWLNSASRQNNKLVKEQNK